MPFLTIGRRYIAFINSLPQNHKIRHLFISILEVETSNSSFFFDGQLKLKMAAILEPWEGIFRLYFAKVHKFTNLMQNFIHSSKNERFGENFDLGC